VKCPTEVPASRIIAVLAAVVLAGACSDLQRPVTPTERQTPTFTPSHTLSSGTVSTLVGRSTIAEGFKVKRKTGGWEIDLHAKDPADIVVATLTIQPGGNVGWHTHPGPGFVQVIAGTASFYEAGNPSCLPTVLSVGQAWLDRGETTHIVRNETNAPVTILATVFVPPGAAPRIDEPAPGNCPF
jgi:quercetin dioxygenase-like cupin family protein